MASIGPVILDCDVGVDDAVAIMLLLANGVDLIGITCVHGNTSLDNVVKNTSHVMKVCNKTEVPIYRGSDKNLVGKTYHADYFHGEGGLGGVTAAGTECNPEHAVTALLRLTKERPGEITLLSIGPLTNIGLAVRMDPQFTKRLKELIIMGGDTTGMGSRFPAAEFNFGCDPEAAHVVLQESECPVTVVPFETCYSTFLPFEWYESTRSTSTDVCRFFGEITQNCVSSQRERNIPGFVMCDALAAAVTIDKSIIEETRKDAIHVEMNGMLTRGQMVQQGRRWHETLQSGPQITVVTKANVKLFQSLMDLIKEL